MVAASSWRSTSSVLLAALSLVLLLASPSGGNQVNTYRRGPYNPHHFPDGLEGSGRPTSPSFFGSLRAKRQFPAKTPHHLVDVERLDPEDLEGFRSEPDGSRKGSTKFGNRYSVPGLASNGGRPRVNPIPQPVEEEFSYLPPEKPTKEGSAGTEYETDAEVAVPAKGDGPTKNRPPAKGGRPSKTPLRDCSEKPDDPVNGHIVCSTYSGCRADCDRGYQFPSGDRRIFFKCVNKRWTIINYSWDTLPDCRPICDPPCLNNGICIAPNKCQCLEAWQGPRCGQSKTMCPMETSPEVTNAWKRCRGSKCVYTCLDGYQFQEGVMSLTMMCHNTVWSVQEAGWSHTTPECLAVCTRACMNDGKCVMPDFCECTPEYRGDHCQYHVSRCDPKTLHFNGGYNCTYHGLDFWCVLDCPGVWEFPPAPRYICDYETSSWSPLPVPQCKYGGEVIPRPPMIFPKVPGTCFTWSGAHYKTFDGKVYSFESSCPYTLVKDSTHGTFTVNLRTADGCQGSSCPKVIQIFLEDDEFVLQATETGEPSLAYRDTNLAIPGQMNGVVSERVAHFVVVKVSGLGLTIKWDMKNLVVADLSEVQWNQTSGLCGRLDGHPDNDWSNSDGTPVTNIHSFLYSWKAGILGESCLREPNTTHPCEDISVAYQADQFCSRLINDKRFNRCRQAVNVEPFVNTCRWDYCGCDSQDRETCACQSFAAFSRECVNTGEITGSWRSPDLCPLRCEGGLVYNPCMQASQTRCGQAEDEEWPEFCVEGCDCPPSLLLHNGRCINPSNCPCTYHNKQYNIGDIVFNDCNSCTCLGGKWVCTEVKCSARCAVVGDPHYTTFDGRHFDFMGMCSYYLVQGEDFSIEAENTPCAGTISDNMHIQNAEVVHFPSCTKSVTIRIGKTVIHLKQRREITVNGNELRKLPTWVKGAYIKNPSNLFVLVELTNGLAVWWDGHSRVYVDAPAKFRDKTAGLCGTFTDNQHDDFLTPEGDVETSPILFGNKWKTAQVCPDGPGVDKTSPCDKHVEIKAQAENYCQNVKSRVFAECHLEVDPEPYYQDCLYDVCSCDSKIDDCFCPILASFGKECARKGFIIDWRAEIRECPILCTRGQVYQVCGDSCSHTCLDLTTNTDCDKKCVEGCNCPPGYTLDNDDICVPVSECPCVYEGDEYKPGHKMQQPQTDGSSLSCECLNAGWTCQGVSGNETVTDSPHIVCSDDQHEVYSDCLPEDEITCQTMHSSVMTWEDKCRPGCACATGYVRDPETDTCILRSDCPCHHGGRSYQDNSSISQDCNTCVCTGGHWVCTAAQCPGICTAWGDSHYKTFDGRLYEFQGACDYILAKGSHTNKGHFDITVQNVACGTDGVTCAKSLTLRLGVGDVHEQLEFSRSKPLPPSRNLTWTIIREAGVFVFAEVPDMGLVLQWDRGTRAYLRLDPVWRGKVHGLCGNYNGNERDDFQTPGGSSEALVNIFGDSWRLHSYCPASVAIKNTCKLHPHRKVWAAEQCAILRSEVFTPCHSEVPVQPYEERCLFDGCGCDTGGDCHCLCTAVAAYAHECAMHGVYVRWRTPHFCPMQCDEECEHYEACIPTCPRPTCDTLLSPNPPMCALDTCVEGCSKNECPPGQVHQSATDDHCVPKTDCQKKCLQINGTLYMEGDVISKDDCHTCYCSQKTKSCRGVPCPIRHTTISPPPSTSTAPPTSTRATQSCGQGWSSWINKNSPATLNGSAEMESVPLRITITSPSAGWCERNEIADISCRSVGTHRPHTEQPWARCSVQEGLVCEVPSNYIGTDLCWDYEVQFLCDCTPRTTQTSTAIPTTTGKPCEEEGWSQWYNSHSPDIHGDLEPLEDIRLLYNVCPENYISKVECRPVGGGETQPFAVCDRTGLTCRNNATAARKEPCKDYELRVLCRCECQDGLGMEDNSISDAQVTASSFMGPEDKPSAARLNADGAWTADVDENSSDVAKKRQWLQVDLEKVKEVTGVVTQGHPRHNWFVKTFAVQFSETNTWQYVMDEESAAPKVFTGNSDSSTAVTNMFPAPVFARFIRIIPDTFHTRISLRLELKGCDVKVTSTEVPECLYMMRCDHVCLHHRFHLQTSGKCLHDEESVSVCEECGAGQYLRDLHTCVSRRDCNCHLNGVSVPPGQPVRKSDCEICQCVNNNLDCKDVCVTPTLTTLTTPSPSTPLPSCTEWSPWMSESTPSLGDEREPLADLLDRLSCPTPLHIECRVKGSRKSPGRVDQGVVCDTEVGLLCLASLNPQGCSDYEVRLLCECPVTEATTESTSTTTTITLPTMTTPPPPCHPDGYVNLLGDVEDSAFSSTPVRSSLFAASRARLYNTDGTLTSGDSWSPLRNDKQQFVQVDLGWAVPVYGVVVAGNPRTKERVRSFTLQYSTDGNIWSILPDDPKTPTGPPKILRGPASASELRKEIFKEPVEARYIKLIPVDWAEGIALRFELIGCSEVTPTPTPPIPPPRCEDPMGLENKALSDQQIVVSSILKNDDFYGKQNIRLNSVFVPTVSAGAWVAQPRPDQYVRFDFQEPRTLSGVIIQGRDRNREWVESFTVRYSPDGNTWNTLQNPDGTDKVFAGNYDDRSPSKTNFDRLIEARFLEIRPKTWKDNIAMRVEVLGCFEPYSEVTTPFTTAPPTQTTPPPSTCSPCPGLPQEYYDTCLACRRGESYDGQSCVPDLFCPCFWNGIKYNASSVFITGECEECECIHTEAVCIKKQCQACEGGELGVLTSQCGCECKPCPPGSRLCPSSNYCLNDTLWCDSVEHCLDDEVDCPSTTTTTTTTITTQEPCPIQNCPDYWEKEELTGVGECPMISCKPPEKCPKLDCPPKQLVVFSNKTVTVCPEYTCEDPCPEQVCSSGYTLKKESYTDEEHRIDAHFPYADCTDFWCFSVPGEPCRPQGCSPGYTLKKYNNPSELCPKFKCEISCPVKWCQPGYMTFFRWVSKTAPCPDFGCIPVSGCPHKEKPSCSINEKLYLVNPGEKCPEYVCRPVVITITTTTPPEDRYVIPPHCTLKWKMLTSFDKSMYQVEICNHILAQDKVNKHWSVSAHRGCTEQRTRGCDGFLTITQDNKQLVLYRDLTVSWSNYNYTVDQAKKIGSLNGFTIKMLKSSTIYFTSETYGFTVTWDVHMNVEITVKEELMYKVDGLCGYFTGYSADDKSKPDGTLAATTKDFIKSWAIGDDICKEVTCTKSANEEALRLCSDIRTQPFTGCHDTLNPEHVMKVCAETTCECLSNETVQGECRCDALSHYVEQCQERNPSAPVHNWRIQANCRKECGPGESYYDCFPFECEQQCENLHDEKLCNERVGPCNSGCFCADGYVRKGSKCVTPDACKDCVCEGYGDPHYTTFDQHKYTFNGECSYVAVQHKNHFDSRHFQVIVHNKRCTTEPITLCTEALSVLFKTHKVLISSSAGAALNVSVDDYQLTAFPHQEKWLKVEQPDHTQVMVTVKELQLEVDFFLENHQFTIRLPSYLYFNKTEGLCGNCNHDKKDDLVAKGVGLVESVDTFGQSWLLEGEANTCSVLEKESCQPLPPDQDPCLYIMDEDIFGMCHQLENPGSYISSCQLDICYGSEPNVTACESLAAYAKLCADLGVCLDWRSQDLCPKTCLGGLEYRTCVSGCVRTCENYELLDTDPDACSLVPVEGCFCPEGMVLDNGTCVEESICEMCDKEHHVGDVWQEGPCKTCECTVPGTICQLKACPPHPMCGQGYTLVEVPGSEDSCCGANMTCEQLPCPEHPKPNDDCGYGKDWNLTKGLNDCPQYVCVCIPREDCPKLIPPEQKQGEEWTLDESGCCSRYIKRCTGECPEKVCPEYHTLREKPLKEDECCPETSCEPPTECIYVYQYRVGDDGFEQRIGFGNDTKKELQPVGEKWSDGLCLNCECLLDSDGHPHHQCVQNICPLLNTLPDHDQYKLESVPTPNQCCPDIKRIACIDSRDIIEVGENKSEGCRSVACVETPEGKVEKREMIYSCEESCPAGWQYQPPPQPTTQCCGKCVQVGCPVGDEVKTVGETWESDDHCTTYTCAIDDHEQIQVESVKTQCMEPSDEEFDRYVFNRTIDPVACCPIYSKVACLLNGTFIQVGEKVQDPNDVCINISCVMDAEDNIMRHEHEITCNRECALGSVYREPATLSYCCGECVQVSCVDNGTEYSVGDQWVNDDLCHQYSCELMNDVPTLVAAKTRCPYFNPECPHQNIYMDDLGCCQLCSVEPEGKCEPKEMPPQETVGIFEISDPVSGICKNSYAVEKVMQCSGQCNSNTAFKLQGEEAVHVSTCKCCKPSVLTKISVELQCESGKNITNEYDNIEECQCQLCAETSAGHKALELLQK
nr:hemocytin-like isoform X3 [Procambarus clarkii]